MKAAALHRPQNVHRRSSLRVLSVRICPFDEEPPRTGNIIGAHLRGPMQRRAAGGVAGVDVGAGIAQRGDGAVVAAAAVSIKGSSCG